MSIVMDPYAPDRFSISLTQRPQWQALQQHAAQQQWRHLCELFAADPARGERLDAEAAGLYLDSFDQWGVELGEALANRTAAEIASTNEPQLAHDTSTNAPIRRYRRLRQTQA
jgi:hypothetical protein